MLKYVHKIFNFGHIIWRKKIKLYVVINKNYLQRKKMQRIEQK